MNKITIIRLNAVDPHRRVRGRAGIAWKLPSQAELLPAEALRYTYPSQLLVAPDNRPWLNFRFLDRILFWSDDQWEWVEIVG